MAIVLDADILSTVNKHIGEAQDRINNYSDAISRARDRHLLSEEVGHNAHVVAYGVLEMLNLMANESRGYQVLLASDDVDDNMRAVFVAQFTEAAMNLAEIMDNNGGHIDNAYEEVVASGDPSVDVEAMSGESMSRLYDNVVTATNELHEKD